MWSRADTVRRAVVDDAQQLSTFDAVFCLFDFQFQLKTCKNGTLSLLLIGYFFEHVITFGWREQVKPTSTMPVSHISELKLYN